MRTKCGSPRNFIFALLHFCNQRLADFDLVDLSTIPDRWAIKRLKKMGSLLLRTAHEYRSDCSRSSRALEGTVNSSLIMLDPIWMCWEGRCPLGVVRDHRSTPAGGFVALLAGGQQGHAFWCWKTTPPFGFSSRQR